MPQAAEALILQRAETSDLPKTSIQTRPAHAACFAKIFNLLWLTHVWISVPSTLKCSPHIATALSYLGNPWQNGANESFKGKFRDECTKR